MAADALLTFAIPVDKLGPVVASLSDDESVATITNAIDRVISRASR